MSRAEEAERKAEGARTGQSLLKKEKELSKREQKKAKGGVVFHINHGNPIQ